MEFTKFVEHLITLARKNTPDDFDLHLSRLLKDNAGITLERHYVTWKQERPNLDKSYEERLYYILTHWREKNGIEATPSNFLSIIRGQKGTELQLETLVEQLQQQEFSVQPYSGTKYHYAIHIGNFQNIYFCKRNKPVSNLYTF